MWAAPVWGRGPTADKLGSAAFTSMLRFARCGKIILQKSQRDAVSRREAKLLHVAVLSSELCCRTSSGARQSLRAAASITDFLAKPAQQAQQTDEEGPGPPAAKREKRAASAATAAAAGAASDWRWWRSGRCSPPSF